MREKCTPGSIYWELQVCRMNLAILQSLLWEHSLELSVGLTKSNIWNQITPWMHKVFLFAQDFTSLRHYAIQ